jgi:beta-phosphoglucomutase-like phosphatase (HAD superfamily)
MSSAPPQECSVHADLLLLTFDGVVVNSKMLICQALQRVLCSFGLVIRLDDVVRRFLWEGSARACAFVESQTGRSAALLPTRLQHEIFASFCDGLHAVHGAEKFFRIDCTVPFHIVSTSSRARVAHALQLTGLEEVLAGNVSAADELPHGMTTTQALLHVANVRHTLPGACLVVTDSPAAARAGRRAGMQVTGFAGGSHMTEQRIAELREASPTWIASDYEGLTSLLKRPAETIGVAEHLAFTHTET